MSKARRMELRAAPLRRVLGLAMLWGLAGLLALLALSGLTVPAAAALLGIAALAVWAAERMRRATAGALVLSEAGLETDDGRLIAPLEQMLRVDRGVFAFKPSNGFVLILRAPVGPALWAPGLYWRRGRRIGVGGVTSAGAGKAMAEAIALRLAARAADADA